MTFAPGGGSNQNQQFYDGASSVSGRSVSGSTVGIGGVGGGGGEGSESGSGIGYGSRNDSMNVMNTMMADDPSVHGMGIVGLPMAQHGQVQGPPVSGVLPANWADSIPIDMQAQWLQLQQQHIQRQQQHQHQHHHQQHQNQNQNQNQNQQQQQQQLHHQNSQQFQQQQHQLPPQSQFTPNYSQQAQQLQESHPAHPSIPFQGSPDLFTGGAGGGGGGRFNSPSQAQSSPLSSDPMQQVFSSPSHQRTQSPQQHRIQQRQEHAYMPTNHQRSIDPSADLTFLQAASTIHHATPADNVLGWQSGFNNASGSGHSQASMLPPDFTDRALSAALASNAHISSSNQSGKNPGINASPLTSSNASSFPHSAGNTTPTILEEDEGVLHHTNLDRHQHQRMQQHEDQRDFAIPDAGGNMMMSHPIIDPQIGFEHIGHPSHHQHHHPHNFHPSGAMIPRRPGPSLLRASIYQQYSNINVGAMEERFRDSKEDCLPFIDDVIFNYISTPSRLGLGERTVMIMTSKVAQKSYGAEKRFLCPPPMVLLVGSSWWSACHPTNMNMINNEENQPTILTPPRLTIAMSGDNTQPPSSSQPQQNSGQDCVLEWASSSGKLLDTDNPSSEFAISGRSIGRQLFINDSDEKRRHCEALVQMYVPATAASDRRLLGVFPSKPIKVISKPSKKRQSSRNSELGVNHGSTISLFHRLRSQTVSTRYLCVSGAPTWFKGSDGNPFLNTDANTHIPNQGDSPSCFVAKTSSWDPFIVYLVDPHMKATGLSGTPSNSTKEQQKFTPSAPMSSVGETSDSGGSSARNSAGTSIGVDGKPGIGGKMNSSSNQGRPSHYPVPPVNALPFAQGNTPIHYNQPVVLQCLNTAVVSPVMVIRKTDRGTTVVGSGQPMLPFGPSGPPPGEMYGEPVSQLHKVAFEILEDQPSFGASASDNGSTASAVNGPGISGHFLGCLNEDVGLRKPLGPRQWVQTSASSAAGGGVTVNPLINNSRPATPTTPITPMTAQMFSSVGSSGVGNMATNPVDFKADPSLSPTAIMAVYGPAAAATGSNVGFYGGNMNPLGSYPYNLPPDSNSNIAPNSSKPPVKNDTQDGSDSGGGKIKRPRRVSSSVLVPQRTGVPVATSSVLAKNRRRGQSLSVIGLQNQIQAQQQQQSLQQQEQHMQLQHLQQQQHHQSPHQNMYHRPSMTGTSSSSSSISSMAGQLPGNVGSADQTLRRTSSFAQSDTSSLSGVVAVNNVSGANTNHWTVDVHDSDVWTIVGVDIARHTFYLPPKLVNGARPKANGVDASIAHLVTMPAPAQPITPIPILHKCTGNPTGPGGMISSNGGNSLAAATVAQKIANGVQHEQMMGGGSSGVVTLIGENFTHNLFIFFGDWRSNQVSIPNPNTIICSAPPILDDFGLPRDQVPITLVRSDGVIFPTDCIWNRSSSSPC